MKKLTFNRRIIVFCCLFIVLAAVLRYFNGLMKTEFFTSTLGWSISLSYSKYSILVLVAILTFFYFKKSVKDVKNAVLWGCAVFVYEIINLTLLEVESGISQYSFETILKLIILIPYHSLLSASFATSIFVILIYWRSK